MECQRKIRKRLHSAHDQIIQKWCIQQLPCALRLLKQMNSLILAACWMPCLGKRMQQLEVLQHTLFACHLFQNFQKNEIEPKRVRWSKQYCKGLQSCSGASWQKKRGGCEWDADASMLFMYVCNGSCTPPPPDGASATIAPLFACTDTGPAVANVVGG